MNLVDYLLVRRDEPYGRSVPVTIMKAISWCEKIAECCSDIRATEGRIAWATKNNIVEMLSGGGGPLIKRAPRSPTWVLVKIERLVLDTEEIAVLRVWAWVKLVKSWASDKAGRATPRRRASLYGPPKDHDVGAKPADQGATAMCQ